MKQNCLLVIFLLLSTCLSCSSNQYFDTSSKQCASCPSLCITCNNNISCTACPSGFYLNTGVCLPCEPPCITCSASDSCWSCSTSYFLDGYNCSACSNGCLECNSLALCQKCSSNYYLSYSLCVQCSINCTCDGNSQVCSNTSRSLSTPLLVTAIAGPILTVISAMIIFLCCRKSCSKEKYGQEYQQQQGYITQNQIQRKQNLKVLGVLRNKQKRQWKTSNNNPVITKKQICSICLLEGVDTITNCKHWFHLMCLVIWLQKKLSCPMCKRQYPKLKKYCKKCCLNYAECKTGNLRNYLTEFYEICIYCKDEDQVKRMETISTAEMNIFK